MSKPKIYAVCKAGCQWETVHKDDFNKIIPYREIIAPVLAFDADDVKGKKIKIYRGTETGYSTNWNFKVEFTVRRNNGTTGTYTAKLPTYDGYRDVLVFEHLGFKCVGSDNTSTIVYEIDGKRETNNYGPNTYGETIQQIIITGASKIELQNADETVGIIETPNLFIMYADDEYGSNMTSTYDNQPCIGTYIGVEISTNPADYTWMRYQLEGSMDAKNVLMNANWYCIQSTGLKYFYDDTAEKITGYTAWVKEGTSDVMYLQTELVEGPYGGSIYRNENGRPVAIGGGNFTIYKDSDGNVQEVIDGIRNDVNDNENAIKELRNDVENNINKLEDEKARKDGYYSQLHSGLADNLASPDGVVNEEPYIFRSTAGSTSVADGYATIRKLKGNTIVSPVKKTIDLGTLSWGYITQEAGKERFLSNTSLLDALYPTKSSEVANLHCDKYITDSLDGAYNKGSSVKTISISTTGRITIYDNTYTDIASFKNSLQGVILTYESTENELIHANITGIRTVGFNAFDGELELGSIDSSTGENVKTTTDRFRTKNFIKVIGGQTYTLSYLNNEINQTFYIHEYDSDKNHIISTITAYISNAVHTRTFTLDAKTTYIRFHSYAEGLTLPSEPQICFHLTHSGYRNGEFEDYWSETREINTLTYFPSGMKSAGSAYDELTPTKAIKRIGTYKFTGNEAFEDSLGAGKSLTILLDGAKPVKAYNEIGNISWALGETTDLISVNDKAEYSIALSTTGRLCIATTKTSAELASALVGQKIYYELAEPEETVIEQTRAIDWNYRESDFGTEEFLLETSRGGFEAPIGHETFYMANLRDEVRNLPKNYISKKSFDNFMNALSGALGISISATYNETTKSYDFSIVK